ncbi:MAG: type 1 glutamine amidotransferase family protein [Ilumatobacteraceae bacterium]
MASTVHLAVYDTLADWEVGLATAHINNPMWQRRPGRYRVATVGASLDPVTTMGGVWIQPDLTVGDVRPDDSAMLLLPGADTWLAGGNQEFAELAARFLAADTPVGAICGATVGLAAAGLLDHRPHTSNASILLESTGYGGGARYVDEPAVSDGMLITATATAPVEFAREVLGRLDLYEPEVLAAWYRLYGEHDPAGYFELVELTAA